MLRDALIGVGLVLVLLTLVSVLAFLYQLVRQHGNMILRLESLEERLTEFSAAMPAYVADGGQPEAVGLPVGASVQPFRLPDLTGRMVGLEDFRGKRVLLVHWSPLCGFCEQIALDLAQLQSDLAKRDTELVFITQGDVEANRPLQEKHGLNCPILLQPESEPVDAFRMMGTPVAYLLDVEGRVAEPLALGAIDVPELAHSAARGKKKLPSERSLAESRIEREGLKAGTPAPAFSLPDLTGRTVSLEDYRGRRVLLVFTDPHCGPCDVLIPELSKLHHEDHGERLALILISRGDVEENRRKVQDHGVEFPVLLQPRWKVSMEYGIFAMPVAFLVGEDGVISRDVARGPAEILALAQDQIAAREVLTIE